MPSTSRFICSFIIGLILLFHGELAKPSKSWAGETVILEHDKGEYPLSAYIEILEDKEGKLTIEDVTSSKFSDKFIPNKSESAPSFGFTDSAYWVRFTVRPPLHPLLYKEGGGR
jgi:hypothetical protein